MIHDGTDNGDHKAFGCAECIKRKNEEDYMDLVEMAGASEAQGKLFEESISKAGEAFEYLQSQIEELQNTVRAQRAVIEAFDAVKKDAVAQAVAESSQRIAQLEAELDKALSLLEG